MDENQAHTKISEASEGAAATTTTTEEQVVDPIVKLQDELTQEKNKYLYLYAEFDTYKKRAIKERSDLVKFGYESFARDLLLAKDNLERSLQYATTGSENLVAGIQMVVEEMKRTFERFSITEIKTVGAKFDPNLHEAVGQEESGDDGIITKEHQKGYSLHGRLLRPAKVIIGTKKQS